MIVAEDADRVERALTALGYRRLHRSADAANYLRGDERVDLLYASRPIARKLLATAVARTTIFGALRVVNIEGLIGLKLQGLINDPRRTQDKEDIRALFRANRATINMSEVNTSGFSARNRYSMKYSAPSTEPASVTPTTRLLSREGGNVTAVSSERDPFEVLDDLMVVVEGLCGEWPQRGTFAGSGIL